MSKICKPSEIQGLKDLINLTPLRTEVLHVGDISIKLIFLNGKLVLLKHTLDFL